MKQKVFRLTGGGLIGALAVLGAFQFFHRPKVDQFAFLEGQKPVSSIMSRFPAFYGPDWHSEGVEERSYDLKTDTQTVLRQARVELAAHGFHRLKARLSYLEEWESPTLGVEIMDVERASKVTHNAAPPGSPATAVYFGNPMPVSGVTHALLLLNDVKNKLRGETF